MVDLRSILAEHIPRAEQGSIEKIEGHQKNGPVLSEIPDIFFDDILIKYKLTRIEILILMSLYRSVWCHPNLHKEHGITHLISYTSMVTILGIEMSEFNQAIRNLENYSLLHTIRAGQYFVRKYLTRDWDVLYEQKYDDFEI